MNDRILELAKRAGFAPPAAPFITWSADEVQLERVADLIAADEREKVVQWMLARSIATGHGDTIEDLLSALAVAWDEQNKLIAAECIYLCESTAPGIDSEAIIDAIRERFGIEGE